jgi:hypothetical protein
MAMARETRLDLTIVVEGGVVQTVLSGDPKLIGKTVRLLDYDVEPADAGGDVRPVTWGGYTEFAFVGEHKIEPVFYKIADDEVAP